MLFTCRLDPLCLRHHCFAIIHGALFTNLLRCLLGLGLTGGSSARGLCLVGSDEVGSGCLALALKLFHVHFLREFRVGQVLARCLVCSCDFIGVLLGGLLALRLAKLLDKTLLLLVKRVEHAARAMLRSAFHHLSFLLGRHDGLMRV